MTQHTSNKNGALIALGLGALALLGLRSSGNPFTLGDGTAGGSGAPDTISADASGLTTSPLDAGPAPTSASTFQSTRPADIGPFLISAPNVEPMNRSASAPFAAIEQPNIVRVQPPSPTAPPTTSPILAALDTAFQAPSGRASLTPAPAPTVSAPRVDMSADRIFRQNAGAAPAPPRGETATRETRAAPASSTPARIPISPELAAAATERARLLGLSSR